MSYWGGSYGNQQHGDYEGYNNAQYIPYVNNLPYFNHHQSVNPDFNHHQSVNPDFNPYNPSRPYLMNQPGSSQPPSNTFPAETASQPPDANRNNNGAVKKKPNDRNKHWNNGRKNERYGSGRTFNRAKNDYGDKEERINKEGAKSRDVSGEFEVYQADEMREANPETKNKKSYHKQGDNRNYYQNNRKNNFKSRGGRFEYYDNRNYGKYGKFNNRHYENEAGAYGSRDDYPKNNWRRGDANAGNKKCNSSTTAQRKLDAASQRERLEQMLSRRMLECLVCCEKIKHTDKVWSCEQCYHIFHLNCIIAWADRSKLENGWRCPACQNVCRHIPKQYYCYCGKTQEPRPVPGVIPHACGEVCMRKGRTCDHKCTILCHPGPCPDCNVMVAKCCGCGATEQSVKCSADTEIVCNGTCMKLLDCGMHFCQLKCHVGACGPCEKTIEQVCFCGKVGRRVNCLAEFKGAKHYACDDICGKLLSCGNHKCDKVCHDGDCQPCSRDVDLIETCPCGRTKLKVPRTSCLDPIPCCDKICAKVLQCGQPAAPHTCKLQCHEGDCPPCPGTTLVRCRCGFMDKELPCSQLTSKADDARCEKKCTKKRLCGKHRCNKRCCIEIEHVCPLPCNHLLACGQHRCDRTCHSGRCPPCMETSFEELYCECGSSVLYPPIQCGTKPPYCNNPCSRARPCGHEVNHSCHTGACPPCTVLCKRWCYGKHEQRSAIPCYQEDFSCGLACGKAMPCGVHKCEKPCHLGTCPLPCKQRCAIKRTQCGHICGMPCHKPPCPDTVCKQSVPVSCVCGLQKSTRSCIDLIEFYKEIEMAQLKDKMSDLLKDQSVDITDIVNKPKKPPATLKILECTEDCRVFERNRRLAIGLQIRNPDLSQKLTPRYSEFMRGWAKKDPQFCQKVHDKLTELVQLAKQSKQKSRSHSFDSMNRDKRHFIHEYCEHFGCESAAYDMEPNRNIVATAIKDKSWLPSMSLLEVLQRENGQRKVPGPVLSKGGMGKSESVALKLPGRGNKTSTPPEETVDYFDNPPI